MSASVSRDPSSPSVSLPSLEELQERAVVVTLPMRVKFRGITHREILLLNGPAGWGEFSAFPEYDDAEAARWLACGMEMAWQGPVSYTHLTLPTTPYV